MGTRHSRRRTRRRRPQRRSRHRLLSLPVLAFLLLGVITLCVAVLLPTMSLLSTSPTAAVSTPATVDSGAVSNATGLLVISVTAIALGVVLAAVGSVRKRRRSRRAARR